MVTREVGVVERAFLKWEDVSRVCDKEALLIVNRFMCIPEYVYSVI